MILLAVDPRPGHQRVLVASADYPPGTPPDAARAKFQRVFIGLWRRAGKQAELAQVVVVPVDTAAARYPQALAAWRQPGWHPAFSAWPTADLPPLQKPQQYRAEHPEA